MWSTTGCATRETLRAPAGSSPLGRGMRCPASVAERIAPDHCASAAEPWPRAGDPPAQDVDGDPHRGGHVLPRTRQLRRNPEIGLTTDRLAGSGHPNERGRVVPDSQASGTRQRADDVASDGTRDMRRNAHRCKPTEVKRRLPHPAPSVPAGLDEGPACVRLATLGWSYGGASTSATGCRWCASSSSSASAGPTTCPTRLAGQSGHSPRLGVWLPAPCRG